MSVAAGKLKPQVPTNLLPIQLENLFNQCFEMEPKKRPTTNELCDSLAFIDYY